MDEDAVVSVELGLPTLKWQRPRGIGTRAQKFGGGG